MMSSLDIYSHFDVPCGITEHAHSIGALLASAYGVRYVTWRGALRGGGRPPRGTSRRRGAVTLWFVTPEFTRGRRGGGRHVGIWMWELEDAPPPHFHEAAGRVNEVWANTRFLERAFATAGVPVRYVPPFVHAMPLHQPTNNARFTILTVSDNASNLSRKNPLGSLQAFQAAFRPDEPVELIVKVRRTYMDPGFWARFRGLCAGWPVRIIEDDLQRSQYMSLLYSVDCLLSLHRSEGLGLPIAEAMRAGIPTVTTGYGGNMDWQTDENSVVVPFSLVELAQADGPYAAGAHWAEPDLDAAASALRGLYLDRERREALGAAAARTTAVSLDPQKTLSAMRPLLAALGAA